MPPLRPVHFKVLVSLFEKDGYVFDRQRGDHPIYVKSGVARPLVIPAYSEIPAFIIKNLLRTAGMSWDRYFEFLQNL